MQMDVQRPQTLAEALEIKAEWPGAVPHAGGTDLMVEINFRRTRSDVVFDLTAPALAEWRRTTAAWASRTRA